MKIFFGVAIDTEWNEKVASRVFELLDQELPIVNRYPLTAEHYKNDSKLVTDFAVFLSRLGFQREHVIQWHPNGSFYRLDFAHLIWKVNIELDGPIHQNAKNQKMDSLRDTRLRQCGWRVIRVQHR
jgi:very-short-patch-repair endonuclease